jgi:C1A family cysteine protease
VPGGRLPLRVGFTVYESFESDTLAHTSVVSMPARGEHVLGDHMVLAVDYDDAKQRFEVRNSWGDRWATAATLRSRTRT